MSMVLFRLITAAALPMLFAAVFARAALRPRWQALPEWFRQAVIGLTFGVVAILGTEFGIPVDGAVLNVRSAAPLTAGLVFGWPAGVIAGVVGAAERWLATLWGVGEFTRVACTLATLMAGLVGAGVRVLLLDGRRPGAFHGLALGVVTEVLHMLLVFLTNAADMQRAFLVVQRCALPMITSNALSVMAAAWVAGRLSRKGQPPERSRRRLSQAFQRWLFICVGAAFAATTLFTASFQTHLSAAHTETILHQNLVDVQAEIRDAAGAQQDVAPHIRHAVRNRHIGQNGYVLVCTLQGVVVSDTGVPAGETVDMTGGGIAPPGEGKLFRTDVMGEDCFCMYAQAEEYVILAVMPAAEALFFRDAAVYIIAFMETVVFAALFTYIYFLIRRLIVNNLHRINRDLSRIAGGDLNVTVDVQTSAEFEALSGDINTTVGALRRLIAEAENRIDRELEMARKIQLSALPSVFPPYPHRREFDLFASMDSAREVGGDFYDFYLVDDRTLVITIADVSDKGIPAAMFMMQAKALLRNATESGLSQAEAFQAVNQRLLEGNDASMFVTVLSLRIDLPTGAAQVANAGHLPPVLCRSGEPSAFQRIRPGLVMAASDAIRYRQTEWQLQRGDLIFLYTDGVTEASNAQQELYGEARLLALLNTLHGLHPQEVCRRVREDVDAFVGGAPQFDDLTMLAFRYHGGDEA